MSCSGAGFSFCQHKWIYSSVEILKTICWSCILPARLCRVCPAVSQSPDWFRRLRSQIFLVREESGFWMLPFQCCQAQACPWLFSNQLTSVFLNCEVIELWTWVLCLNLTRLTLLKSTLFYLAARCRATGDARSVGCTATTWTWGRTTTGTWWSTWPATRRGGPGARPPGPCPTARGSPGNTADQTGWVKLYPRESYKVVPFDGFVWFKVVLKNVSGWSLNSSLGDWLGNLLRFR